MKLFSQELILNSCYPHVMGILNMTPDSFSDGGIHSSLNKAIKHTDSMINAGATIIDIGGESTRPGALEVSLEEELSRVIPVMEAIVERFDVWISVDTSKPEVIRESARVGAHIINDVRSLTKPGALKAAAETRLFICLMHMQGQPSNMQNMPQYKNILTDVKRFFNKYIERCKSAGIAKEKLLLDPGFGFGKNIYHNYKLLAHLSEFHHFGLPLLVGMSRKSMISKLLNVKSCECIIGSISCAVIAAIQGVHIIRAHDVRETVEAMRIVKATMLAKENKYYE